MYEKNQTNMDVLLTGYNGFLGSVILNKLSDNHLQICKVGRSKDADVKLDLTSDLPKMPVADMVVHCAGKAHLVPKNAVERNLFFEINFEGTRKLCEAIELSGFLPKTFVFISTIAVYGLSEGSQVNEDSKLVGVTPYASSKIKAEQYLHDWGSKNNINILILRLPLIVGTNAPGNLYKIIKGIQNGNYFSIGGGKARKSMVLASDVADLICRAKTFRGIYNLTDGYHPRFAELESMICEQLKKPKPFNMPLGLAKIIGKIGDLIPLFPVNTDTINKITQDLTFSDLKARHELGWNPSRVIDKWKI